MNRSSPTVHLIISVAHECVIAEPPGRGEQAPRRGPVPAGPGRGAAHVRGAPRSRPHAPAHAVHPHASPGRLAGPHGGRQPSRNTLNPPLLQTHQAERVRYSVQYASSSLHGAEG